MVSTRHSLPNVASFNPSDNDPNIPKELRRLHIEGKETMRGDKVKKQKKNVYYWRGAAYQITADTPKEWLDQDPVRVRRKQGEAAEEDRSEATSSAKKTLKRKSTSALEGTATHTDGDFDKNTDNMAQDTRRPAKRARRNTVNNVPTTSSRQRKQSTTTSMKLPHPSTKTTPDYDDATLKFDYSSENARRMRSSIEAEKRAAREKGYSIDMITVTNPSPPKQQSAAQAQNLSNLGARLARDIARMAKLNAAIPTLLNEYERVKQLGVFEAMLKRKASSTGNVTVQKHPEAEDAEDDEAEVADVSGGAMSGADVPAIGVEPSSDDLDGDDLRLADAVDQVFDDRDAQSQLESQLNDEVNDDGDDDDTLDPLSLPTNTIRDSQPLFSESDDSEDLSPKRQDSATSATSPDLALSSKTTSIEEGDAAAGANEKSPATHLRNLPSTNRGGHKLRWSLGTDGPNGISKEARYQGTDRAEGMIHRGRLNGESKTARRRRVLRETKLLESWPLDRTET